MSLRYSLIIIVCVLSVLIAVCLGPEGFGYPASGGIELRLSRVVTGALAGFALATSGLALQLLFRNGIADPYIIGVSGGAAVGGAAAIGLLPFHILALQVSSAFGAAIATGILLWVLAKTPNYEAASSTQTVLVAGILINAVAAAVITTLKTTLDATTAQTMLFWLVGRVGYPSRASLMVLALTVACGFTILLRTANKLAILALGEREAERLGIEPAPVKRRILLATSLMVGVIAPLCGLVGFVGLIVPHMARRILPGVTLNRQLVACGLCGAAVLAAADGISRILFVVLQTELPVGALMALLGAPLMAVVLFSGRERTAV